MLKIALFLLFTLKLAFSAPEIPEGSFVIDDEITNAIGKWSKEIFKVANLKMVPNIRILASKDVNALTTYGGEIIIFTGLFMKCENVAQFLGVLAHEIGHIEGKHIARKHIVANQFSFPVLIGTLLGGAIGLLSGDISPLLIGAASGMHVAEMSFLKHSRQEEESADSAALNYLDQLKWPTEDLYNFFKILDPYIALGKVNPYGLSHPLTSERQQKIKIFSIKQKKKYTPSLPPEYEETFQRIKAKLNGFMGTPAFVIKHYQGNDSASLYARAIALYRTNKVSEALTLVDTLLSKSPKDPYISEFKGQIYFETGKIQQSLPFLKNAYQINPKGEGINLLLAHALIENPEGNQIENCKEALNHLNSLLPSDSLLLWQLLAKAYGKSNNRSMMHFALAEQFFLEGKLYKAIGNEEKFRKSQLDAKRHAEKVLSLPDKKAHYKAKDLLNALKSLRS